MNARTASYIVWNSISQFFVDYEKNMLRYTQQIHVEWYFTLLSILT